MSSRKKKASTSTPKKKTPVTTPVKKNTRKAKGKVSKAKKSLSQQFAEIADNVDVSEGRPQRTKKEVNRFEVDDLRTLEKKEVDIQKGSGTKLKDIKPIQSQIKKLDGDDHILKKLHSLLYGRSGKVHETKKNIYKWNGFAAKNKAESREKMTERLGGWKLSELRNLAQILCIGGDLKSSKDDAIKIIARFLIAPKVEKLNEKKEKKRRNKLNVQLLKNVVQVVLLIQKNLELLIVKVKKKLEEEKEKQEVHLVVLQDQDLHLHLVVVQHLQLLQNLVVVVLLLKKRKYQQHLKEVKVLHQVLVQDVVLEQLHVQLHVLLLLQKEL